MKPRYTIERWPLGWTVSSTGFLPGIPMDALGECKRLFPRNAVLDTGINHHLNTSGHPLAILCIATPANSKKWRTSIEILLNNANISAEERWWRGFNVGRSSATIFSCFSTHSPATAASFAAGAAPFDSADLSRCILLLSNFPEWRDQLDRIAQVYPNTRWPAIIARWSELEAATPEEQTNILQSIK